MQLTQSSPSLLTDIRTVLTLARTQIQQTINSAMVQTYWQVGRLIVEDEQAGQARAQYGAKVLTWLSAELSAEFGAGFDVRNLSNMRHFYRTYPIWNAVRTELSWTHILYWPIVNNFSLQNIYHSCPVRKI